MKRHLTILATVALSLVGVAAILEAAPASAQTGGVNQIVIRSQGTNTGQIMADSVTAAQAGWLAIYTDTSTSFSAMIGWAPIHKGVNTNVKINVNNDLAEPFDTLYAVLHIDREAFGKFDWPGVDTPVEQDGKLVRVAFGTQAPPVPTAPAAPAAPATPLPPARVVAAAPKAPATTTGAPQTLPGAGESQSPAGRLVLVGLGFLLVALGVTLPRVKAYKQVSRCVRTRQTTRNPWE